MNIILIAEFRHNKEDKERKTKPEYKLLRNVYSGVESSVNMLEHHDLNRCMDKGLPGFKRNAG